MYILLYYIASQPFLQVGRGPMDWLLVTKIHHMDMIVLALFIVCLYSQCPHVICYSVDQGIYEIPDGCDFRPLGRAGKRGGPRGSGNCYERYD